MYLLLILVLLFISALILSIKTKFRKEWVTNVTMTLFMCVFFWFPGAMIGFEKTIELSEKYIVPIVQFQEHDTSVIRGGGSFLGWAVNGGTKLQYVVIEQRDDGMLRTFHNQDNTWIKETEDKPRIEYNCYKEYYSKWLTMPWYWKKNDMILYYEKQATIFVPTNTVQVKFEKM